MSIESLDPAWAELPRQNLVILTTATTPDGRPHIAELAEIVSRAAKHFIKVGPAEILDVGILLLDPSKGGRGMRIFAKVADAAGELYCLMLTGNTKFIDLKLKEYRKDSADSFKFDSCAELSAGYQDYLIRRIKKVNATVKPELSANWSAVLCKEVCTHWQPSAAVSAPALSAPGHLPWEAPPPPASEWAEGW